MFNKILPLYGIDPSACEVKAFGDGLINHTWLVNTVSAGYILQQLNQFVFKRPFDIDQNLSLLKEYLDQEYPEYLFIAPVKDLSGNSLNQTSDGYFRMFPFVENSHTVNVVDQKDEAYEAARQFGKFSRLLSGFDVKQLHTTLPDFHNLILRYRQFLSACEHAEADRKEKASALISYILENKDIVETFERIFENNEIPLRVIHHDTKISNVLFDAQNKGICVIDLDTVMPGYFISDVGDMIRTYICALSEEETDMSRIVIREEFFKAIYDGYMEEMGTTLTETEKSYFIYAGKFLIYMQALRFLADYLQNDVYYGSKYEGHNFYRAENQLILLKRYLESEKNLKELIGA
ncbi:phosphotransferase enzyme family protein [Pedobacter hartonius]|uniref:Phosphotransferase enzyme family protein n=1 Tax=Pedobacter hartonius TaxID=425514 RepID=A0A1H4D0X6_9SPHI|nr:aminoglycoside phosphotransferase family protein [Pedobacter hartonius]SEA66405.1 Phosphotransferase enzyme family protein [Pedobacter hartonius]